MTEIKNSFGTVKEISKLYPSFSESSIRYMLFNGQKNGLSACVRRIGRKIIFNIPEFEEWINSRKEVNNG
ncbi:MAG: hypothetical protein AMJ43_05885 [Coxiella sp. DG_40]|nr:MAG: hypothetical protein AMJ43_05885 [Coxiella sp. DG_40]